MRNAFTTFASVTRLHIVAIASLGTLTFGWLVTGRYPWALALVTGLDWFVVNLLNRVVDAREDAINRIGAASFAARHRRALLVVGGGLLLASLPLVHLFLPAITPWRVAAHALGLAYNFPLLGVRLKQVWFWKNTASALGFLATLFAYPLATAHAAGGAALAPGITPITVAVAMAFFFLLELSYEVIYDLRDVPGDRAAGVRSYPVVHGPRVAGHIVRGLLLGSMAVLLAAWVGGLAPWRLFIMVAAAALQYAFFARIEARGITEADCVGLTWTGAGLLATYHAWWHLGLPGSGLP